jgi:type IV secretory pathway protease TraF
MFKKKGTDLKMQVASSHITLVNRNEHNSFDSSYLGLGSREGAAGTGTGSC